MDVDRAKEPPRTPPPRTLGNVLGSGDTELGSTPSKWSTAATPGTPRHDVNWNEQPDTPTKKGAEAIGNEDLREIIETEEVHPTPSNLGQHPLSSVGYPPIGPPSVNYPGPTDASPDSLHRPPPAFSPEQINPSLLPEHAGQNISPFTLSPNMGPQLDHALPPPAVTHYPTSHLATSSSSSDPFASIPNPPTTSPAPRLPTFHPPAPAPYHMPSAPPLPPPPPPLIPRVAPPDPVELTPALISKVQKHCRFAISSLDYEDGEQAKKELRAALALLEG
jgi:vacuolar protein sorting-associated protein VTA1